MSAFSNPWGDIDQTRKGAPYVVSADGWGWFALGVVALVPVMIMGLMLRGTAEFISSHPILIIIGYIILTAGFGAVVYKKKTGGWTPIGMLATTITFLPILLTEMLIEVPEILKVGNSIGEMLGLLIQWVFVTLLVVGVGIFIHAINMLSPSPVRHMIFGLVYCVVTGLIMANTLTVEEIDELKMIYGMIS